MESYTLGFIGIGKIGNAVARGYAGADDSLKPSKIVVSPRNKEKSEALRTDFPDIIVVAASNEEVVSSCNIVFIGLLPDVARAELPALTFTDSHKIVSMMAAVNYEEVVALCRAKPENVVKIVPLPAAARRTGPILFHPPNPYLEKIVGIVGVPAAVKHEHDMKPLISVTGHISAFYQLMGTTQDWIVNQGIPADTARSFVASFYSSLAGNALLSSDSFGELVEEAATPGGLNDQVLTNSNPNHMISIIHTQLEPFPPPTRYAR